MKKIPLINFRDHLAQYHHRVLCKLNKDDAARLQELLAGDDDARMKKAPGYCSKRDEGLIVFSPRCRIYLVIGSYDALKKTTYIVYIPDAYRIGFTGWLNQHGYIDYTTTGNLHKAIFEYDERNKRRRTK